MSFQSTRFWNQFLVRYLIAFSFWEALGVPLRILFFAKLYGDSTYKTLFVPLGDLYWPLPFLADLIQVFFIGLISNSARKNLPDGIAGGFLFGIFFSIASYVSIAVLLLTFTMIPAFPLTVMASVLSIQTIIVTVIFFLEYSEG